jgi:hypothetical protein
MRTASSAIELGTSIMELPAFKPSFSIERILSFIKNKMPYRGMVLYTGEDTLSFGGGMLAVPAAALFTA